LRKVDFEGLADVVGELDRSLLVLSITSRGDTTCQTVDKIAVVADAAHVKLLAAGGGNGIPHARFSTVGQLGEVHSLSQHNSAEAHQREQ